MIITQLSRIRGKYGSGMSPCFCLTCFMCQMPNVQIEFVELINEKSQSDYGISCMMYKSIIPLSDYQLYLILWKFRSKMCRYLTWWICQIGLLNVYYSICVIISLINRSDMVISFVLPCTGDIIYDDALKWLLHHCVGSVEKPDQERIFIAALCVNINYWMFQFNFWN